MAFCCHGFVPLSLLTATVMVAFLRCLSQRLRDGWVFCPDGRKPLQQDIYVPTQLKPAARADWRW
jgi:elongation factor P hydroxylase